MAHRPPPLTRRQSITATPLVRLLTVVALGVAPVAALVSMFVLAYQDDSLAADFHHEIYPQAVEMLAGNDPYPPPNFDPTAAPNFIWPPLVAYGLGPLTLLPGGVADVVMVLFGLVCFAASLWLLRVRDWRIYGVVALWPQVAGEMRVAHLTPQLCLLLALAWRYRAKQIVPGAVVGLAMALKFFVWPYLVWLVARRRPREAALALAVVGASLLLLVPYGLPDYARALSRLGKAFDQDSYSILGLLAQLGLSDGAARVIWALAGAVLLGATFHYASVSLATAAALLLSPIAWLDYFALTLLPLAIVRPRLGWVWFVPLTTWGLEGAGLGIGDVRGSMRLLGAFAVVLAVSFVAERSAGNEQLHAPLDPAHAGAFARRSSS